MMETKFNFNSAICTSKIQSERLLSLGLRKETADMVHSIIHVFNQDVDFVSVHTWGVNTDATDTFFPAWSLDRLRELLKKSQVTLSFFEDGDYVVVERYGVFQNILDQRVDMWDNLCDAFLYLITEGYFNKEYLV